MTIKMELILETDDDLYIDLSGKGEAFIGVLNERLNTIGLWIPEGTSVDLIDEEN